MSRNSPAIQLYIILIYFAHYRDVLDSYWSFFCRLLHLTNQAFESQWLHYTKSHSCNENKKPSLDIGLNIHKIIFWCWYILRYNIQCNDHSVIKVEIVQIKKWMKPRKGIEYYEELGDHYRLEVSLTSSLFVGDGAQKKVIDQYVLSSFRI